MNCLVTGGAGFIGSNIVEQLLFEGHTVSVIDNLSTGKKENLDFCEHIERDRFFFYEFDINDTPRMEMIFYTQKFDIVFHLAARPRVQFSIASPDLTHEANVNGTLNILMMAKKFGVKRFVYSSSSSIYGDQPSLPLKEEMKPNPMSPYALQKLVGEEYCRLFHNLYGMETISLRYFNVYGFKQDPKGEYACMIPKFISLIDSGQRPTIFGDGEQTRDFTFVSDVVHANMIAAFTEKDIFGQSLNIGGGSRYSVNQITSLIKTIANRQDIEPIHSEPVIESRHTLADISRSEIILEWKPEVKIEEGLKYTYKHLIKDKI